MQTMDGGTDQYRRGAPLLDRMWERVDVTAGESDTALFYDLLFFGELIQKLVVLGLVGAVEDTRERHQYRLWHQLVRANGIGEWAAVLEDVLTGPASALLVDEAIAEKREIMQKFSQSDDTWQRHSVTGLQRACQAIDPTRQLSAGKVSLQTLFNDFAWLRNRTRGHGAPKPSTCELAVPDLVQALGLVSANLSVFGRGWAHVRRNMSGKYRVSRLAGDCSAFDRLKSDVSVNLADGVYIAYGTWLCPVRLVVTDADLTDIFVANGGFKERTSTKSDFELLSYYSDATRNADGSDWIHLPTELPPSETKAQPSLEIVGGSFANLPAKSRDYVPRAELERELLALLRDDRHAIVTLVGRGGVGKTSLALEILYELARAGDFFSILWFSARDIDLLVTGAKQVSADVLTLEEVAESYVDLVVPHQRTSTAEAVESLGQALSGQGFPGEPILFVFDNFETVRNPAELFSFLDRYVRLPNKVLITSRFRDFRGDYPVPVPGMERAEFDALVEATATRLGVADLLTEEYRDRLYDECDGHPYVCKVLLGEVARTKKSGSIERVMAAQDDILTALFERTFDSISPAAQRVFLTLASWRSVTPRLALEAALLRQANERINVSEALDTLEQSSLVELVSTAESEGEFVRLPLAAYLFGQRKLRVSPSKAAIDADAEFIRMFGSAQRSEIGRGLEPRVKRMLSEVAERSSQGRDVHDELAVLDYVARNFPPARLLLADYFAETDRHAEAVQCVSAYLEVVPTDRSAWLRLANLYLAAGNGPAEVFARVEVARLAKAPLEDISNAASTLNRHLAQKSSGLSPDESRSMARELVALFNQHESQCDAYDYSRMAWLCLHLSNEAEARRAVVLGLQRDSDNRHCLGLARKLAVEVPLS